MAVSFSPPVREHRFAEVRWLLTQQEFCQVELNSSRSLLVIHESIKPILKP